MQFPPALGAPLGRSEDAPNSASAPGAAPAPALQERQGLYSFGDILPSVEELPWGASYGSDFRLEGEATPPVAGGLACNQATSVPVAERSPLAGLQDSAWVGASTDDHAGQVQIAVTGWPQGTAGERLAAIVAGDFPGCVWLSTPTTLSELGPDRDAWTGKLDIAGVPAYVAIRRVDDVLVSVTASNRPDAQAQATRLADLTAGKVAEVAAK